LIKSVKRAHDGFSLKDAHLTKQQLLGVCDTTLTCFRLRPAEDTNSFLADQRP